MTEPQSISKVLEKQVFPLPRKLIEVDTTTVGDGLFYFHVRGDFLKGILVGTQKRQSLHYEFKTYLMKVWSARQDGVDLVVTKDQIVEFPANMKMRRIIEDNELFFSLIRIVFKGKRGRYKEYDVFKDTGTFYESEDQKHGRSRKKSSTRKYKSNRKPGFARAGNKAEQANKATGDNRPSN